MANPVCTEQRWYVAHEVAEAAAGAVCGELAGAAEPHQCVASVISLSASPSTNANLAEYQGFVGISTCSEYGTRLLAAVHGNGARAMGPLV